MTTIEYTATYHRAIDRVFEATNSAARARSLSSAPCTGQSTLDSPKEVAFAPGERSTLSWAPVAGAAGYNIFRDGLYHDTVAAMPSFMTRQAPSANGNAAGSTLFCQQRYTERLQPGTYEYFVVASTDRPTSMVGVEKGPTYSNPSEAIIVEVGESSHRES